MSVFDAVTDALLFCFALAQMRILVPSACGRYGLRGGAALHWLWRTQRYMMGAAGATTQYRAL